jgi:hypothetical protein
MSKTILLSLTEANALLVHRMGQAVPELAEIYDSIPFMVAVLEDVFLGRPLNPDLTAGDILKLEGLDDQQAGEMMHEVANTITDIVSHQMPHLDGSYSGYHFKVHKNFDLEITIPTRSLVRPEDTAETFSMEIVEAIQDDVASGHFVPEHVRRYAGC